MAKGKPTRRPKGTGSISDRKDGRKDVAITLRGSDGSELHYRTTTKTRLEADRWLTRIKYEHERNTLPSKEAEKITVAEFLDTWLENSVKGTVEDVTYRAYEEKVRLHLKPAIGKLKLKDLTTRHLQALYRKKTEDGLGWRAVRYIHTTIHMALHQAEGWDLVRKNVARWAKPPRIEHKDKPVLTVEEAKAFLGAIRDDRLEALYMLAVTTGLRRGELLGLRWEDLDLEKGTLVVSRGGPTKATTKTSAGRRPAVLPPRIVEALRRQKTRLAEERLRLGPLWKEHGLVFPTTIGTPHRGDNVLARSLKPLMRKAGLPPHNFQTLRRSTSTFLVLLKVRPRVAMDIMGHSDVTTTMKTYQQVPDELREEAARLMGELLFGKEKTE